MAEVDINEEKQPEIPIFGAIDPNYEPEDWEVYRTDVDLDFTLFLNPICWLTFFICFDSMNGFGFRIGPVFLAIVITKFIRHKNKIDEE